MLETNPNNLIDKARKGDQESMEKLYIELITPLYRFCLSRTAHPQTAEDLAQDAFIKGTQALGSWTDQGKPVLAFFITIARNLIIDRHRTLHPTEPLESHFDLSDGQKALWEQTESSLQSQKLLQNMSKLKVEQNESLALKYFAGLSSQEVAEIMGKSPEAVRQLQSRGLAELKKIYESE